MRYLLTQVIFDRSSTHGVLVNVDAAVDRSIVNTDIVVDRSSNHGILFHTDIAVDKSRLQRVLINT